MENRHHGSFLNLISHSLKDILLPEFSQFVLYDIFFKNCLDSRRVGIAGRCFKCIDFGGAGIDKCFHFGKPGRQPYAYITGYGYPAGYICFICGRGEFCGICNILPACFPFLY